LPQYLVDVEVEAFRAFREGRPLPPPPAESVAWCGNIAAQVGAGKVWGLVHVIDWPLSDYTRFELALVVANESISEPSPNSNAKAGGPHAGPPRGMAPPRPGWPGRRWTLPPAATRP
jgi:hypothetical protein